MGSFSRADAIERIWRMLRDTGVTAPAQMLTDDEINDAISDACRTYSLTRPWLKTVDIAADGTNTIVLPVADGWVDDFSTVRLIESPVGNNPPTYLDGRKFALYRSPTGLSLRWLVENPVAASSVRLTFAAVHSYETVAADTTVPDIDHGALCALAASLCAVAIAAGYARTHEPVLSADAATYRTKSQEWLAVASRWEKVYHQHMMASHTPGSGFVNWDTRLESGVSHLTHNRWTR